MTERVKRAPVAPQLLSVEDAAERLGTSHDSVRTLILHGDLEAIDISTGSRPRLRVTEEALADFIARRTLPKPGRPAPKALRVAAEPARQASR